MSPEVVRVEEYGIVEFMRPIKMDEGCKLLRNLSPYKRKVVKLVIGYTNGVLHSYQDAALVLENNPKNINNLCVNALSELQKTRGQR